jgi:hypothetical protein
LAVLLLGAGGCASGLKLYDGPERPRAQVALVDAKHEQVAGRVTQRITIEEIDGVAINSSKYDHVELVPGNHDIEVNFYKRTDPPAPSVRISIGGKDLGERAPSRIITSAENKSISVNLRGGKSYYVTASDFTTEKQLPGSVPS